MLQEFQWSRSLTQVLLSWTRGYFKLGMSLGQKIHFLFGQLWYVMYAAFMLIGNTLPLVAIGTDRPLVQINLLDFWLLAMPATVMVLIPIMYLKGLGLLRPSEYDAVCLETIVFSYIRWPWALWGVVYGTIGALKGTELPFKVTKKGENGIKPFPLRVVMPYLLLALINASFSTLFDPVHARGYLYFSVFNAVAYSLVSLVTIAWHIKDNWNLGVKTQVLKVVSPAIGVWTAVTSLVLYAAINVLPKAISAILGA